MAELVYKPSRTRVCAYSFIDEKDLPEGQKLLTCSKCNEACYVDREAQIAAWPIHKLVCRSIENDNPLLKKDLAKEQNIMLILNHFKQLLSNHANFFKKESRLVIHLFQQLRKILESTPKYFDSRIGKTGQKIIDYIYEPLRLLMCTEFQLSRHSNISGLDIVWSIPGFANFFLSDEIFLSKVMLDRKRNKMNFLQEGEDAALILGCQTEADARRVEITYSGFLLPSAWTGLLEKFFIDSSIDVDRMLPKSSKLSLAIMRRLNHSFACPYSMTSYPSFPETVGLWPGKNSLLTEYWAKVIVSCPDIKQMCLEQGGLVPGLSTFQLFEAILSNPSFLFTANHSEFGKMIHNLSYKDCLEPDEGPLNTLTPNQRLEFLRSTLDSYTGTKVPEEVGNVLNLFINLLMGSGSMKTTFRMHEALSDLPVPIDDHTQNVLKSARMTYLKEVMPKTNLFVRWSEHKVNEEKLERNEKEVYIPEEILHRICEYAVDPIVPVKCSCGLHDN